MYWKSHANPTVKKWKHAGEGPQRGGKSGITKKFIGKCYNYGKMGHHAKDFQKPWKAKGVQTRRLRIKANMTEVDNISTGVNENSFSTVVSKATLVGILKNGGWTLELRTIFTQTGRCSHLTRQWTVENNFSWRNLQLLKLKHKENYPPKKNGQGKLILNMISGKDLTLKMCCMSQHPQEPCVRIIVEQEWIYASFRV